jgi:hypothetical protein
MKVSDLKRIVDLVCKDVITREGLIKTGQLLRSIESDVRFNQNDITIEIEAVYYYEYLDEGTRYIKPYNLTDKILNDSRVIKAIEDFLVEWIEKRIDKI